MNLSRVLMAQPSSSIDSNYLVAKFHFKAYCIYLIRIKDICEDIWTIKKYLKKALSACKLKILQIIYQNKQQELTKKEIVLIFLQELKKLQLYKKTQKYMNQIKEKIQEQKNKKSVDFFDFFDFLKFSLTVTPTLWKNLYHLINQAELFEVVGRIFNKNKNFCSYLIKYKYYDNHKYLLWINKSQFFKHPANKIMKNFDTQNQFAKNIIIDKRFEMYKQQLLSKFLKKKQKKYCEIIGKAKIQKKTFVLAKLQKQNFQEAYWFTFCFSRYSKNINEKIKLNKHDLNISPFFDREIIKKIIYKQIDQKSQKQTEKKQGDNQKNQDIEKKIDEKIQLLMKKYQRLKFQVKSYQKGIEIFDKNSDSVLISSLREKINLKQKDIKAQKQEENMQGSTSAQKSRQNVVKQQFQSDEYLDSQMQDNEQFFDQDEEEVKFQYEIQDENELKWQEDSEVFYQKCKRQYQEEQAESIYLGNEDKKTLNKIKPQFSKKKSIEKTTKKQKEEKQSKFQDTFYDDGDQTLIKKEQFLTSNEQSTELEDTKEQNQVEKKVFKCSGKIRKWQRFLNSTNCSDVVYRVCFNDGRVVYGTKEELIKTERIGKDMMMKMMENSQQQN